MTKMADHHLEVLAAAAVLFTEQVAHLQAATAKSVSGNALVAAEPVPLVGSPVASQVIRMNTCRLVGYAIRETTGVATAKLNLRLEFRPGGQILVPINLAANESAREWWGPTGLSFIDGMYLEIVSGSIEGAVFLGAVD